MLGIYLKFTPCLPPVSSSLLPVAFNLIPECLFAYSTVQRLDLAPWTRTLCLDDLGTWRWAQPCTPTLNRGPTQFTWCILGQGGGPAPPHKPGIMRPQSAPGASWDMMAEPAQRANLEACTATQDFAPAPVKGATVSAVAEVPSFERGRRGCGGGSPKP